jgi:hypothetical protein
MRLAKVLLLSMAILLSGCAGGSAKPLSVASAPPWSAGDAWTYQVQDTRTKDVYVPLGAPVPASELVLRVVSVTDRLNEEPVYLARSSLPLPGLPFLGSQLAFAASNLAQAGYADWHDWRTEEDGSRAAGCQNASFSTYGIYEIRQAQRLQLLKFPLDAGQSWSGAAELEWTTWDYRATVIGEETVTVPAGAYRSMRISVDMQAREFDGLQARIDAWYAPEARFFARIDARVTLGAEEPQEVRALSLSLKSFDRAAPQDAAPGVAIAPRSFVEPPAMQIISDVAFPYNFAAGPVTARFGLQSGPFTDAVQRVDHVPDDAPAALAGYTVRWHGWFWPPITSPSITISLDRASTHWIGAEIVSNDVCVEGSTWVSADVPMHWEALFRVGGSPGTVAPIDVATVPVQGGARSLLASWQVQPGSLPVALDAGTVRVLDPEGEEPTSEPSGSNAVIYAGLYEGDYRVRWVPQTARLMDTIAVKIRVEY